MLAVAYAASVARPPQAQQQHALVTEGSKHSLLCVSTAVNLKTATCNSDCNNGRDCPEACFCLEHTYYMPPEEDDLALSMSGSGLERVSDALHSTHASAHLTSLTRELGPADTLKACASLSDTVDTQWSKCRLGRALARLPLVPPLCLFEARLAAPGSAALPGTRASRLQSRRFVHRA